MTSRWGPIKTGKSKPMLSSLFFAYDLTLMARLNWKTYIVTNTLTNSWPTHSYGLSVIDNLNTKLVERKTNFWTWQVALIWLNHLLIVFRIMFFKSLFVLDFHISCFYLNEITLQVDHVVTSWSWSHWIQHITTTYTFNKGIVTLC